MLHMDNSAPKGKCRLRSSAPGCELEALSSAPGVKHAQTVCLKLNHFKYRILDFPRIFELLRTNSMATWLCQGSEAMRILQDLGLKVKKKMPTKRRKGVGPIAYFCSFLSKTREHSLYCSTYTEVLVGCSVFERWSRYHSLVSVL